MTNSEIITFYVYQYQKYPSGRLVAQLNEIVTSLGTETTKDGEKMTEDVKRSFEIQKAIIEGFLR